MTLLDDSDSSIMEEVLLNLCVVSVGILVGGVGYYTMESLSKYLCYIEPGN